MTDPHARSRAAFPDSTPLAQIPALLAVVAGDIARHARAADEGAAVDSGEVARELGNLVLSATRWIGDLGCDVAVALDAAAVSQERYAARRSRP